jgi:hypothetical protein
MNTTTGLTAVALTLTVLAAGACGTEQASEQPAGGSPAAAAAEAANVARTEHADALRWARGAGPTSAGRPCHLSPDAVEYWVSIGQPPLACAGDGYDSARRYGDDRRQQVR